MNALIKRHLLTYLRDRWAVFFSFLSVLIILGLFVLFLRTMQVDSLPSHLRGSDEANYLVYSFILSGILVVSTVTIPLGFLHVFTKDTARQQINDFYVTPLERRRIVISYMFAGGTITFVLAMISFAISLAILVFATGYVLPLVNIVFVILLVMLSTLTFTAIFFYVTTYLKTLSAHGNLSTLVGTLIGFLAGLYVPIGAFSQTIRTILGLLPPMQIASLMRTVYMDDAIETVFSGGGDAMQSYASFFGVDIAVFDQSLSPLLTLLIFVGYGVVFTVLSIIRLNHFKVE